MPLLLRPMLALVALFLAGCGAVETGVGVPLSASRAYTAYDASFSLRFPVAWTEVDRRKLPDDTTFAAVGAGSRELLVVVTPLDGQPSGSEAMLARARTAFGDRLTEAAVVPFADRLAVRAVGDAEAGGRTVRLLQYLVTRGDRLYALTLRTPPDTFAAEVEQLEAIAASFRLAE